MEVVDNTFAAHHVALTVKDIETSAAFYAIFGFRLALQWTARDGSLIIAHLSRADGFILEMWQYAVNRKRPIAELDTGAATFT